MSLEKKAETAPAPEAPKGSHMPIADVLKSTFSDKTNLTALLAAAAGSGLLGGYVSSKSLRRPGETPGQRRARILANALGAGLAGGGAVGAGILGANVYGSRYKQEPGLGGKIYDATVGKLPALGQAGGILGSVGGAYAGGAGAFKDIAAEKVKARDALNLAGSEVQEGAFLGAKKLSPEEISRGLLRGADPTHRTQIINALREPVNPSVATAGPFFNKKQLAAMDANTERLITRAGFDSKLGLKGKAGLKLNNAGRVTWKGLKGSAGGGIGGAAVGTGLDLILNYLVNKTGQ
jgi:hypothetical protein